MNSGYAPVLAGPMRGRFRLLPLLIEQTELSLSLGALVPLDLTDPYAGGDRALARLVETLMRPVETY